MKRIWICLAAILLLGAVSAAAAGPISDDGYFRGIFLGGRVRVVDSFGDVKVKVVDSFPDLRVQAVDSFADELGE